MMKIPLILMAIASLSACVSTQSTASAPQKRQTVEIRDFSALVPENQTSEIQWTLHDYRLIDQTPGRMLKAAGQLSKPRDYFGEQLPCVLEYDPGLQGLYEIQVGLADGAIDMALDGEVFVILKYENGARYGQGMGEPNREHFIYFKTVDMTGRKLRIRVANGTHGSIPLGVVGGNLTCIRFTPMDKLPQRRKPTKMVGVVCDGFSHYFGNAQPGENIDLRLPETYGGSDVRMIMQQTAGYALWKSNVSCCMGELLTLEEMEGMRYGDIRIRDYFQWVLESGRNLLGEQAEACHKNGIELHYSIRSNLYFGDGAFAKLHNGRFWFEHPECRLPGDTRLDFANRRVRDFYLGLCREALEHADLDGLNMDLTRWPPVLNAKLHTPDVIVSFMKEVRALADEYGRKRGKRIKVSVLAVDGYHAGQSLEDQCIDVRALVSSKALDFICIESYHLEKYIPIAHEFNVPIYSIFDDESVWLEGGHRVDPLWVGPQFTRSEADDPAPGEEYRKTPIVRSVPAPWEIAVEVARDYAKGADGFVKVNKFEGDRTFSDLGSPEDAQRHAQDRQSAWGQSVGDYIYVLQPPKE